MELKDAYARILVDGSDVPAFHEVRRRYRLLVRTAAAGPDEEVDENASDDDEESEDDPFCEAVRMACEADADWQDRILKRARREGHLLKSLLLDELLDKTPAELESWRKRFVGTRIHASNRTRTAPIVGAKDGLRAMLLRGFEVSDAFPELGTREAMRRAFERLVAIPVAFGGPTKARVRKIDEALGCGWGRVWLRLDKADRLDGDWASCVNTASEELVKGASFESDKSCPAPKRKLRWDEPKPRDGVWIYHFRSVADAVNRRLEERIREASRALESEPDDNPLVFVEETGRDRDSNPTGEELPSSVSPEPRRKPRTKKRNPTIEKTESSSTKTRASQKRGRTVAASSKKVEPIDTKQVEPIAKSRPAKTGKSRSPIGVEPIPSVVDLLD